ncbi:MAG TPA: Hsp20/alpha crystallin family protein [Candidatus Sellimonas avistercoris]|nr:Hsp20/alpha crystallin family protein [Candidatus Sellimonas avistercoris]
MMMPSIFGENLFDDWMDFPFDDDFFRRTPSYNKKSSTSVMRTDIRDTDDSYELDVDLPGYKKDEINVQLKEGYLTISASKNTENDEKDKKGNYIRRERYNGTMSRSFYVGNAIHQDDIRAKYADGILKISVPKKTKKEVEQANYISIEG